jgi:hypothetical protein
MCTVFALAGPIGSIDKIAEGPKHRLPLLGFVLYKYYFLCRKPIWSENAQLQFSLPLHYFKRL